MQGRFPVGFLVFASRLGLLEGFGGFLDFTESDRLHENSQDYCGTNQNCLQKKRKPKSKISEPNAKLLYIYETLNPKPLKP